MEFLIGAVLALSVGFSATFLGLDRDRAFYPTVMMVIASYYALFAVMGGSARALTAESAVIVVFLGASIAGFRTSLWLVVAALAAHGVYDFFHGQMIAKKDKTYSWETLLKNMRLHKGPKINQKKTVKNGILNQICKASVLVESPTNSIIKMSKT
jgi:hypothetical protein